MPDEPFRWWAGLPLPTNSILNMDPMSLWIAVPEAEDGSWLYEPESAHSQDEVVLAATSRWSGKLPPGVTVTVYSCHHATELVLPTMESTP